VANFATHLNVSAFVSGVLAAGVGYSGVVDLKDSLVLFFTGIVGGILPDIDHDKSTPFKMLQFFFSNLISFLVIVKYIGTYPILNLLIIWVSAYAGVVVFFYLFKKFTKHRGIIHSIPAALLFSSLTALISYDFFDTNIKKSYLLGLFLFIGYITHLLLDEVYSIDLTGKRLKKSFGSAFKLYSNNKLITLLFYSLIFLTIFLLPKKEVFFHIFKGLGNV